jgi:hypothetical protein
VFVALMLIFAVLAYFDMRSPSCYARGSIYFRCQALVCVALFAPMAWRCPWHRMQSISGVCSSIRRTN